MKKNLNHSLIFCLLLLTACQSGSQVSSVMPKLASQSDWQAEKKPITDQGFKTQNQSTVPFQLNATGISHIYWPFKEARNEWKLNGNGVGDGDHLGDDYYADDWNYMNGGNSDAGKKLLAAIPGEVIYVNKSGSNGDGPACPKANYGNRVIIAYGDYAIHYTHMQDVSVSLGQTVKVGDEIGSVGYSGLSGQSYCTAHLHLVLYKNINQVSSRAGLGKTARYWLERGNAPTTISGGASQFAAPFYLDATAGSLPQTQNGEFDGAGSLVSPQEDCWGCNHDVAAMHPHPGTGSTVVFQWLYDENHCKHIDLHANQNMQVIVKSKAWSEHLTQQASKMNLGPNQRISLSRPDNNQVWTTLAVTSTQSLNQSAQVFATCKRSSDTFEQGSRENLPTSLVDVTYNYFWTGTGSLISQATKRTGFGIEKDLAITFSQHNSLTSFQWLANNKCPRLEISSVTGGAARADVATKVWNQANNAYSPKCTSLPCQISADANFYIVKIKSEANAIPGGGLKAICK